MNDPYIYVMDWAHLDRNLAIYDTVKKKFLKTKPKAREGIMIVTENAPYKVVKEYLEAGNPVMCCSGSVTANMREQVKQKNPELGKKTHENDTRIIWGVFQRWPHYFRPMRKRTPLNSAYANYKQVQDCRVAVGNRNYSTGEESLKPAVEYMKKAENEMAKLLATEVVKWPIYDLWLKNIPGCADKISGALIHLLHDCSRFDSISKLWAYGGLKVENGKVQKHVQGQQSNWSDKIKTVACSLAFLMYQWKADVYAHIFSKEKQRWLDAGLEQGHAHNRAKRKVAKIFLSHYWVVARTLAGLPVSQPWVTQHGGHCDYIEPPYWRKPDGPLFFEPAQVCNPNATCEPQPE